MSVASFLSAGSAFAPQFPAAMLPQGMALALPPQRVALPGGGGGGGAYQPQQPAGLVAWPPPAPSAALARPGAGAQAHALAHVHALQRLAQHNAQAQAQPHTHPSLRPAAPPPLLMPLMPPMQAVAAAAAAPAPTQMQVQVPAQVQVPPPQVAWPQQPVLRVQQPLQPTSWPQHQHQQQQLGPAAGGTAAEAWQLAGDGLAQPSDEQLALALALAPRAPRALMPSPYPAAIPDAAAAAADDERLAQPTQVPSQVTVAELRGRMSAQQERQRVAFATVLERCYARVRRCASVGGRGDCMFEVPGGIAGLPRYDVTRCVHFVLKHLARNGFQVEYDGDRQLHIRWEAARPPPEPPAPPPPRPRQPQAPAPEPAVVHTADMLLMHPDKSPVSEMLGFPASTRQTDAAAAALDRPGAAAMGPPLPVPSRLGGGQGRQIELDAPRKSRSGRRRKPGEDGRPKALTDFNYANDFKLT